MASELSSKAARRETRDTGSKPQTRRMLNVPWLVGTLVLAAVLAPAAYFWHGYQAGLAAGELLKRADTLEKEKKWKAAAVCIHRFLKVHPDDSDARVRLAETFDESARLPAEKVTAVAYYYGALARVSDDRQSALRRRLAELLLEVGQLYGKPARFASAEAEAKKLRNDDPQGWRLLASALYLQSRAGVLEAAPGQSESGSGGGDSPPGKGTIGEASQGWTVDEVFREARKQTREALKRISEAGKRNAGDVELASILNAGDVELASILARIYRDEPELMKDESQILGEVNRNELVEWVALQIRGDKKSALATAVEQQLKPLGAGVFDRVLNGELSPETDAARAELAAWAPTGLDLRLLADWSLRQRARLADQCIDQMVMANPKSPDVFLARYRYRRQYGLPGAQQDLQRALFYGRDNPNVMLAAAQNSYQQAQRAQPGQTRGHYEQARMYYERVIKLAPRDERVYVALGQIYIDLGEVDRAIQTFKDGLAKTDKESLGLNLYLAKALISQGRLAEARRDKDQDDRGALDVFDAAMTARRQELHQGLESQRAFQRRSRDLISAKWHLKSGSYLEAAELLKGITLGSKSSAREAILNFRACVLLEGAFAALGREEQAEAAYEQAAGLKPIEAQLCLQAAEVWTRAGEPGSAIPYYEQALALELDDKADEPEPKPDDKVGEPEPKPDDEADETEPKLDDEADDPEPKPDGETDEATVKNANKWVLSGALRAETQFSLAQAQYRRQIELEPDKRDWTALDKTLAELDETPAKLKDASQGPGLSDSWRLALLNAEYYAARDEEGDQEKATQLLADVEEKHGKSMPLLRRLVRVYQGLGLSTDADRVSKQLKTRALVADRLWDASTAFAAGKLDEAEQLLREAVQLAPGDLDTLDAFFKFSVGTGQIDGMSDFLQKLAEDEQLTRIQRELILAHGYSSIEDAQQAERHYREAVKLVAEDDVDQRVAVRLRLANLLLRSDLDKAEEELRGILDLKNDCAPARRWLVFLLANRGGQEKFDEIPDLLERPGSESSDSAANQRLLAKLLAKRSGSDNLKKAREVLENLIASSTEPEPLASDRLLLVSVCERLGDLPGARLQYDELLDRAKPDPSHLASYVSLLLRHDLADEADERLRQLEEAAPDNLIVVALRARWFDAKDRTSEIEPLVESLVAKLLKRSQGDRQRQADLYLNVGNLYSMLKQYDAAERWHRRLFEAAPGTYERLVTSLTQQGRTTEAIRLCEEAMKSDDSTRPAMVLAAALAKIKPTAEDFRLAEPVFKRVAERHQNDDDLLFYLAAVRIRQDKIEDAVALYRQILDSKPRHLLALNNLATLLAEQPGRRTEALQYIDRAIDIAGPQPGLLDTKGMVLVHEDKAGEAVSLLQQAVQQAAAALTPDPRYDFHLAVAYYRTGDHGKARTALNKARDRDLEDRVLTDMDRELLDELGQKLQ